MEKSKDITKKAIRSSIAEYVAFFVELDINPDELQALEAAMMKIRMARKDLADGLAARRQIVASITNRLVEFKTPS